MIRALTWLLFGSPDKRRRVRQELARVSANLFGDYPLSDDYQRWRLDKKFIADFKRLSPQNYFSQDRKFTLREFVKQTKHVHGSIAECGSYSGVSAFFIAQAAPDTDIYLFDSWQGLSEPDANDNVNEKEIMGWKKGDLSSPESKIRENLAVFQKIHFLKGWIPDRFNEVKNEKFRLVHIDVDLYQPTKDSMDFFYPILNPGGIMVLDDYGSTMCPGAYDAIHEYMRDKPEQVILLTTGQGVVIKN